MVRLNEALTLVEKSFNVAGSLPIVGIYSGACRMGLGKVQLIAGACFGFIGLIGEAVGSNQRKWRNVKRQGSDHMLHGALNILRGFGELLCGLTIIGSVILFAAQAFSKEGFKPRFKYMHHNFQWA